MALDTNCKIFNNTNTLKDLLCANLEREFRERNKWEFKSRERVKILSFD